MEHNESSLSAEGWRYMVSIDDISSVQSKSLEFEILRQMGGSENYKAAILINILSTTCDEETETVRIEFGGVLKSAVLRALNNFLRYYNKREGVVLTGHYTRSDDVKTLSCEHRLNNGVWGEALMPLRLNDLGELVVR